MRQEVVSNAFLRLKIVQIHFNAKYFTSVDCVKWFDCRLSDYVYVIE